MKKAFSIFLLLTGMTTITAWVVSSKQNVNQKIIAAIQKGDVQALAQYFTDDVNLLLYDEKSLYDKASVSAGMEEFFNAHPPEKFIVKHQGASKSKNSAYLIGMLHSKGQKFRITIGINNEKIEDITISVPIQLNET